MSATRSRWTSRSKPSRCNRPRRTGNKKAAANGRFLLCIYRISRQSSSPIRPPVSPHALPVQPAARWSVPARRTAHQIPRGSPDRAGRRRWQCAHVLLNILDRRVGRGFGEFSGELIKQLGWVHCGVLESKAKTRILSRESARDAPIHAPQTHQTGTTPVRTNMVRHSGALDFLGALRRSISTGAIASYCF